MTHAVRFCQPHLGATLLAAAVALALSACSSSDQEAVPPSTPTAATTAQTGAPAAPATPAAAVAKFTAYAAPIPSAPANTQCALDTINAKPAADAAPLAVGSDVVFGGWAGNGKVQAGNGFLLVLKGAQSYSAPIIADVARPDVAKALSSDGMANSGFNLAVSLAGVAAGSYQLFIVDPADATNACDLHRSTTVQ